MDMDKTEAVDTISNPFPNTAPAKLYAFLLQLRPIEYGTLMPFSGELVHGAWLDWLRSAAPDVAAWLHEGNKRRYFTCSSLQFPIPPARMRSAERDNIHLPVEPEKIYTIRVTLLFGELFPLFHQALMNFNQSLTGVRKPPFMQLGKRTFLLEEVVISNDDPSGWTGFTSFSHLVEKAKSLKLGKIATLNLEFDSLTTFSRGNVKNASYGNYHALLPLPQYVFPGLAKRWYELAPAEYHNLIDINAIEQYIHDDGIIITDYDLKPHQLKFTTHIQPGFIGSCKYTLRGPDAPTTEESPLTVRQQLLLLAQLAFYCGVGYKTAMGMGRTRVV
ncbi:MAG TPA: CRISPR system precrRNA processing endoribonuclease RAMP protein Cas6 [Ktedonobacteraceae bacterium]|nr:CRISPR system precrRNA processing endoribonuclease RAMP protein Cas6 [Ktedonobacteraceae bacterium]